MELNVRKCVLSKYLLTESSKPHKEKYLVLTAQSRLIEIAFLGVPLCCRPRQRPFQVSSTSHEAVLRLQKVVHILMNIALKKIGLFRGGGQQWRSKNALLSDDFMSNRRNRVNLTYPKLRIDLFRLKSSVKSPKFQIFYPKLDIFRSSARGIIYYGRFKK